MCFELSFDELEKFQVVAAGVATISRNTRYVLSLSAALVYGDKHRVLHTHSRILPVEVDAVQTMLLDEVYNILRKDLSICWLHARTEDLVSGRISGESPPSEAEHSASALQVLEALKCALLATDIRNPFRREIGESEVNVSISISIDI